MTNARSVFHDSVADRICVPRRFNGRIGAVLTTLIWGATLSTATAAGPPSLTIVADLIDEFDEKLAKNGMAMGPRGKMSSGRSMHRALYQHPKNADDATITYSIKLPDPSDGAQIALVAWACVLDAVIKQDKDKRANGVRMIVRVDGKQVFSRVHTPGNWLPLVVPLDTYAGKTVELQLATNAIDGNTNYDWAHWGDPRVMVLPDGQKVGTEPLSGLAGLLVAPSSTVGDKGLTLKLQPVDASGKSAGDAEDVCLEPAPGSEFTVAQFDLGKRIKPDARQVRVAAEKGPLPRHLRLLPYAARLHLVGVTPGRAIATAGGDLPVLVTLKNIGLAPWVSAGEKVSLAIADYTANDRAWIKTFTQSGEPGVVVIDTFDHPIPAGEQLVLAHKFKAPAKAGLMAIGAALAFPPTRVGSGRTQTRTRFDKTVVAVQAPSKVLAEPVSGKTAVRVGNDQVVLQNPACRVVFLKQLSDRRIDALRWTVHVQLPADGRWRTVAVCPELLDVYVKRVSKTRPNFDRRSCTATSVSAAAAGTENRNAIAFDVALESPEHHRLHAKVTYSINDRDPVIDVAGELTAPDGAPLRRFCPISLRVADGLPTKDRGQALFPGLEYLDDGEPSSSTRDAHPPINNRLMPDPLKITVPMMMVSTQVGMVTLMWDPNQKWNGKDYGPCAAFGSPNLVHRQENHLLEVFVPTFPDYMNENERLAAESYEMKPGSSVSVSERIVLRPEGDAVTAMRDYFALNPPPKPAPKQHDLQTLYAISRHGLTQTVWYEDKQKSSHCVGWSPTNAPQFGVLLWLDAILAADPAARKASLERAHLIWKNSIRDGGPAALASGACCHIMREEAPFYTGHIEAVIKQMTDSAAGQIRGRNADGVWGFQPPGDARHESLGPRGYASQGIVARGASELLRKARITGSAEALQAGLKALAYHDRFHVPHGAQGWECPIYEPDVLGAAYAIGAYLDAYEMTGERRYLDRAVYWAWTGMAFQYVWQAPDREQWMRYASIPVFGTTFFTHSWLGNPVQWCGLVYAYYLQKLSAHDTSFPWKQVAEGITVSGEWLQFGDEKPELKGSYPDGLYGRLTKRCPAMINPEDIILNRYAVEGHDPRVKTIYVRRAGEPTLHITSSAKLGKPKLTAKTLKVPVTFYKDQYSGTLLANCSAPASVALGNQSLKSVQAIPESPQGWKYVPGTKHLIVRARHADDKPAVLTVRFK